MNKERLKGIVIGAFAAALAMGLSVTALAASRNISVSDGIRVVMNGQVFQPKDAKGNAAPLFTYNGTVYAPIRALCKAAGMTVDYDAATKTASVTTGASSTAPSTPAGSYITEQSAKDAALKHAGVSASKATFLKAKLERDDGRMVYDVEFYSGQTEYDYEIDALTGAVLSFDHDFEGAVPAQTQPAGVSITAEQAKSIAQKRASGATVVKCELDYDDGVAVYEIELRSGRTEYECEINAATGDVLKWEVDYD